MSIAACRPISSGGWPPATPSISSSADPRRSTTGSGGEDHRGDAPRHCALGHRRRRARGRAKAGHQFGRRVQARPARREVDRLPAGRERHSHRRLLERLGIADAVKAKVTRPESDIVSELVAKGEFALGLVVMTQILTTPGSISPALFRRSCSPTSCSRLASARRRTSGPRPTNSCDSSPGRSPFP